MLLYVPVDVHDRRRAPQRGTHRRGRRRVHLRRERRDGRALLQVHADLSQKVPALRAAGVSGEGEGGARDQRQPDLRHDP